jgi:UDP:flavonoid glycosyltransferase YjiC (YdhE family)
MRVLFASTPGYGHVQPMLPLARALEAAGHPVAIAVDGDFCALVEVAGLTAFPAGASLETWFAELERRHPTKPWNELPPERIMQWFFPRLFGDIGAPPMLDDLLRITTTWKPDVIISETYELAGPICAAVAGILSVHHTLSPVLPRESLRLGAASTAPLRERRGIKRIAEVGEDAALCLDICPPSMRSGVYACGGDTIPIQPVPSPPMNGERLPAWVGRSSRRPLVHATFGTAQADGLQVLATVIDGLRDEPVRVVVTVGPGHDPASLGEIPSNVHVERYIPHSLLLPQCTMVIGHGGAGTMLGSLAHGLPLLTIPFGADQYINADACAQRGVGRTLLVRDVSPERVRAETRTLLHDPAYAVRSRQVRDEIQEMVTPQESVSLLEQLAPGR